jgi:hypothetical protein
MKNNEIPKIQQVEATLTESKVFFSSSLLLSSIFFFLSKEIQGNFLKVVHVLDER